MSKWKSRERKNIFSRNFRRIAHTNVAFPIILSGYDLMIENILENSNCWRIATKQIIKKNQKIFGPPKKIFFQKVNFFSFAQKVEKHVSNAFLSGSVRFCFFIFFLPKNHFWRVPFFSFAFFFVRISSILGLLRCTTDFKNTISVGKAENMESSTP